MGLWVDYLKGSFPSAFRGSRYSRRIEQPSHCARRIRIISSTYTSGNKSPPPVYTNSQTFYVYAQRLYVYIRARIHMPLLLLYIRKNGVQSFRSSMQNRFCRLPSTALFNSDRLQ